MRPLVPASFPALRVTAFHMVGSQLASRSGDDPRIARPPLTMGRKKGSSNVEVSELRASSMTSRSEPAARKRASVARSADPAGGLSSSWRMAGERTRRLRDQSRS
jgi:hypothetical protein